MIKEINVEDLNELKRAENDIIMENINNPYCLNKNKAWTGLCKKDYLKQYINTHKQKAQEYSKQYRNNNIERKKAMNKDYYNTHKEQYAEYGKQRREQNKNNIKEYMKKYRETKKERILEKKKEYMKNHKSDILHLNEEWGKQKCTCDCGSTIRRDKIKRHQQTKKHLTYLANKHDNQQTVSKNVV